MAIGFVNEMISFDLNESAGRLCWRGRGRPFNVEGLKTEKSGGTNNGESGAWNLEAERMRSRVDSTGGCVKLKASQR